MITENNLVANETCYECGEPITSADLDFEHEAHEEWCTAELAHTMCECDRRYAVHAECCAECEGRMMPELNRLQRGHWFYPRAVEAAAIPALYATEKQPLRERIVHLHYFVAGGSSEFWLIELEPSTGTAFGYVNLGDPQCAEWGGFYLPEMEELYQPFRTMGPGVLIPPLVIERDLDWIPKRVDECDLPGSG